MAEQSLGETRIPSKFWKNIERVGFITLVLLSLAVFGGVGNAGAPITPYISENTKGHEIAVLYYNNAEYLYRTDADWQRGVLQTLPVDCYNVSDPNFNYTKLADYKVIIVDSQFSGGVAWQAWLDGGMDFSAIYDVAKANKIAVITGPTASFEYINWRRNTAFGGPYAASYKNLGTDYQTNITVSERNINDTGYRPATALTYLKLDYNESFPDDFDDGIFVWVINKTNSSDKYPSMTIGHMNGDPDVLMLMILSDFTAFGAYNWYFRASGYGMWKFLSNYINVMIVPMPPIAQMPCHMHSQSGFDYLTDLTGDFMNNVSQYTENKFTYDVPSGDPTGQGILSPIDISSRWNSLGYIYGGNIEIESHGYDHLSEIDMYDQGTLAGNITEAWNHVITHGLFPGYSTPGWSSSETTMHIWSDKGFLIYENFRDPFPKDYLFYNMYNNTAIIPRAFDFDASDSYTLYAYDAMYEVYLYAGYPLLGSTHGNDNQNRNFRNNIVKDLYEKGYRFAYETEIYNQRYPQQYDVNTIIFNNNASMVTIQVNETAMIRVKGLVYPESNESIYYIHTTDDNNNNYTWFVAEENKNTTFITTPNSNPRLIRAETKIDSSYYNPNAETVTINANVTIPQSYFDDGIVRYKTNKFQLNSFDYGVYYYQNTSQNSSMSHIVDSSGNVTNKLSLNLEHGAYTINLIKIMSIYPSSSSINVTVSNFTTIYKKWNESASNSSTTVNHTIGNFSSGDKVVVNKNGILWKAFQANASGYINFTYDEGFPTITFEAQVDNTAPTVSLLLSDTSIYTGRSTVISCSSSDNYDGSLSTSLTVTKPQGSSVSALCGESFTDTDEIGTYTVSYSATDDAGNSASVSKTFMVHKRPSYFTTTTIAKEIVRTGKTIDLGELTDYGASKLMAKDSTLTFTIDTVAHSVKVKEVGKDYVVLEISSDPMEVTVKVDESKEVDLDNDGVNDLEITLDGISYGKGDLTFKRIERVAEEEVPEEEEEVVTPEEEIPIAPSRLGLWITILVIIIVVVVGYYMKSVCDKIKGDHL